MDLESGGFPPLFFESDFTQKSQGKARWEETCEFTVENHKDRIALADAVLCFGAGSDYFKCQDY